MALNQRDIDAIRNLLREELDVGGSIVERKLRQILIQLNHQEEDYESQIDGLNKAIKKLEVEVARLKAGNGDE